MTSGIRWDDGLRGVAHRIAEVVARRLRVVAGPGTGKTFSLMRRVARLLQKDEIKPRRILVCTFTRTAARDLQDSLQELGVEGATEVRAGTIHSFCFWLLSREEVLEATGRVPRPLLAKEERFLIEDIKDSFGGVRDSQKLLKAFNAAWARLQTEEPGWPVSKVDRDFDDALDSWLQFHRGMLLGELVPVALHFLRNNPANPITSAFDQVIVDEYQDLNRSEQVLLDLLAENGDLTIVGDADQSIYSFKHAHPEGVASFGETHAEIHDESLEECRRCPPSVVEIANRLISHNRIREPRELVPRRENPEGEVHVVQWQDIESEARGLARFIKERIGNGKVDAGKVLVLAPRRQFGYAIRDALKALGTPAHSFFQEEALDGDPKDRLACRAQESYALLNLLVDPDDRVALRCWCGFGSQSLRSGAWKRLWNHCEDNNESPRRALERMVEGDLRIAHCSGLVARFVKLKEHIESLEGLQGGALIDALFPEDEDWAEALRAAAETAEDDDVEPSRLLESTRTAISQPELPVDVDYVRIMSLHKSKGLTADLVIVAGCIEGLIPTLQDEAELSPQERKANLEEQRRLFYVAVTRTRRTLILSSVTRLPRNLAHRIRAQIRGSRGSWVSTISTRFLPELGPTLPRAVDGESFLRNQGLR